MIRVAVIDRSVSVRGLVTRVVTETDGLELGACCDDVAHCLQSVDQEHNDVAVVGLHPVAPDQIEELFGLLATVPVPLLLLTPPLSSGEWELATRSSRDRERRMVLLAKPNSPDGWQVLKTDLPGLVRDLGRRQTLTRHVCDLPEIEHRTSNLRVIAIGASAGGPVAVCETLRGVGERLRLASVLIVQHIGAGFEAGFVNWLAREFDGTHVALARHGEPILPATVRIAPAHAHLAVDRLGRLHLDRQTGPNQDHHCPSVNVLFETLAKWQPADIAGILLSGMGTDGVNGLLALRRGGALTIAQDEASCSVYGMPKYAFERGAAMITLAPRDIGRFVGQAIDLGLR